MTNPLKQVLLDIREAGRTMDAKMGAQFHSQEIEQPVFILGCGRSGTTILGTALSHHPQITYLNERRDLWHAVFPNADIWSKQAQSRAGKLVLTEADATDEQAVQLRRIFHYQITKTQRPTLVEKLPINNFRVGFLRKIFPDARYIHILRNGIEVARSIERMDQTMGWYSKMPYRLQLMKDHAAANPDTADLYALCENTYELGLVEWRLSLDHLYSELPKIPEAQRIEITYDALVADSVGTLNQLVAFMGLPESTELDTFARETIQRKNPKAAPSDITEKEAAIAGKWLDIL